jgi:hypothetical protein
MGGSNNISTILLVLCGIILTYLVYDYLNRSKEAENGGREGFDDDDPSEQVGSYVDAYALPTASASSKKTGKSCPTPSNGASPTGEFKATCPPKDNLTTADLLPKDAADTKWAQVNPTGQGDLQDQNFLTAGHHYGINTVGSSMRNSNYGLRSEPPNPQMRVSPWANSTIAPDLGRKNLEVA